MVLNNTHLLSVFLFFSVLTCCTKDKTAIPPACIEDSSFELEVKPIFINNCTSCHNSNLNYGGIILEDFNSITDNINNSLMEMKAGTMPYDQNFLPAISSDIIDVIADSLIEKIDCWKINGMKNN
jgi:hypothetical protein